MLTQPKSGVPQGHLRRILEIKLTVPSENGVLQYAVQHPAEPVVVDDHEEAVVKHGVLKIRAKGSRKDRRVMGSEDPDVNVVSVEVGYLM